MLLRRTTLLGANRLIAPPVLPEVALPQKVQLVTVVIPPTPPILYNPPPLVLPAIFLKNTVLVKDGELPLDTYTPPPEPALFSVMIQLRIVGEAPIRIPPP